MDCNILLKVEVMHWKYAWSQMNLSSKSTDDAENVCECDSTIEFITLLLIY